jgi:pimeloyl-ACP methyl ester carboxylesterase
MRPDRVRGVVGLSVPYRPRGPVSTLTAMRGVLGDGFYMNYFQAPGVADAELARDPRSTLRRLLYSLSGDAPVPPGGPMQPVIPAGRGMLDILIDPQTLPDWLSEADIDFYASEFARTGFTGGLNWYRTIDLTWELMAAWTGAPVLPPALYVAGDRDLVVNFPRMREGLAHLRVVIPNLKETIMLPGCGHWTQQERPAEVNAALLDFLRAL